MELVTPDIKYKASYLSYIEELGDEERYPFPLDFDYHDFKAMLLKIEDFKQGRDLPKGYVPSTTLWLVESDELIGVTNIRHHLNEQILTCGGHIGLSVRPSMRGKKIANYLMQQSIEYLAQRRVSPVHIHCYKSNLASANTIQHCDGVLASELTLDGVCVQRYLVETNK